MVKNVRYALLLFFTMTSFVSRSMGDNTADSDSKAQAKAPFYQSKPACKDEGNGDPVLANKAKEAAPISSFWVKYVLDNVEKLMDEYLAFIYTDDCPFYITVRVSDEKLLLPKQLMFTFYHNHIEFILCFGSKEQKNQVISVIRRMLDKLDDRTRQLRECQLRLKRAKARRNWFFLSLGTVDLCWLGYAKFKQAGDPFIPVMVGAFLATAYGAVKLDEREYDRKVLLHKNLCFASLEYTTRMWKGLLEKETLRVFKAECDGVLL